jgi:hypothetical protein
MQAEAVKITQVLGSFVPLAVGIYGFARIVAHPFQVQLTDTKDYHHQYLLNKGVFWDSAEIKKINTANPTAVSISNIKSIRQMEITQITK